MGATGSGGSVVVVVAVEEVVDDDGLTVPEMARGGDTVPPHDARRSEVAIAANKAAAYLCRLAYGRRPERTDQRATMQRTVAIAQK
jgi:hypothetical protein